MVNPEHFELPKEQLLARLKWYEEKYGSSIGKKRGVHNWKNLFKKPTLQEGIIFFMLVMMLFVAWSYNHDMKAYKNFYEENSCNLCYPSNRINPQSNPNSPGLLDWNITIKEAVKESET